MNRRDRHRRFIAKGCIANRDVATFFRDRPSSARRDRWLMRLRGESCCGSNAHGFSSSRTSLHYTRTIPGKKWKMLNSLRARGKAKDAGFVSRLVFTTCEQRRQARNGISRTRRNLGIIEMSFLTPLQNYLGEIRSTRFLSSCKTLYVPNIS